MDFIDLNLIWGLGTVNIMIVLSIFSFTNGLVLLPASQVILIFGGLLVGKSNLGFLFIFIILVTSNFFGNYLLYYVSFNWGEGIARKILPFRKETLDNNLLIVNYLFAKYGSRIIFIGRNLPVLHSLVSVPAGVAKVSRKNYIFYTLLGICTWSLIFMGIGIYFGNNYNYFIKQVEIVTVILTIVLLGGTHIFYKAYLDKVLVLAKEEKKSTDSHI